MFISEEVKGSICCKNNTIVFNYSYNYWLCFWAQLQHKEQANDTLIAMSRKLEVVALQIANRGWNNVYRLP
jgi:hypothetical protein